MKARHQLFALEYLKDLNGKQAAIRAGYSPHTAKEQAVRLLGVQAIQEAICKAKEDRNYRLNISNDMVVNELIKIGFSNIADFIERFDGSTFQLKNSEDIAPEALAAIKRLEVSKDGLIRITLHDKISALLKLYEHTATQYPKKKRIVYRRA